MVSFGQLPLRWCVSQHQATNDELHHYLNKQFRRYSKALEGFSSKNSHNSHPPNVMGYVEPRGSKQPRSRTSGPKKNEGLFFWAKKEVLNIGCLDPLGKKLKQALNSLYRLNSGLEKPMIAPFNFVTRGLLVGQARQVACPS